MTSAVRFPFIERDRARPSAGLMPYVPIAFSQGEHSLIEQGLLDTGAAVNVLPFRVGIALGFDWDQQTVPVTLSGNLASSPAKVVTTSACIAPFPAVRLVFAWSRSDAVPVILGQTNFFLAFDVCFFRSRSCFEILPRVLAAT